MKKSLIIAAICASFLCNAEAQRRPVKKHKWAGKIQSIAATSKLVDYADSAEKSLEDVELESSPLAEVQEGTDRFTYDRKKRMFLRSSNGNIPCTESKNQIKCVGPVIETQVIDVTCSSRVTQYFFPLGKRASEIVVALVYEDECDDGSWSYLKYSGEGRVRYFK